MKKNNTYFVDIDGTIFVYRKFETYKETDVEVIKSTNMIILTTARPEDLRDHTVYELSKNSIPYDRLIMGIERGPRYLINDMDPNNPGKRAIAINVTRNGGIKS